MRINQLLLWLYAQAMKNRWLCALLTDVRRRLEIIAPTDEATTRLETIRLFLYNLTAFILIWTICLTMNRSAFVILLLLCSSVYLYALMIDLLVHRLEMKVLEQLIHLLASIRRQYHRHGMVLEAILEAAAESPSPILTHGTRIAECLRSPHPEEALRIYYEIAANRYLQALAGISCLIQEYGDEVRNGSSLYLQALAALMAEIELDRIRRQRLRHLLQSLQTITVLPILCLQPIRMWATDSFPPMHAFYESSKGIVCELAILLIAVISFLLVRQLQVLEWRPIAVATSPSRLERGFAKMKFLQTLVSHWTPARHSHKHEWLRQLLAEVDCEWTVASFYFRRFLYAILTFWTAFSFLLLVFSFQPWFILICLMIAMFAYMAPLFFLLFRWQMRKLSLKQEIEQLQTMLTILTPLERMTVEEVLQWMERFSHHFKRPLQACLLRYSAGQWQALEKLKDDVAHPDLRIMIEQLQEAVERLDLRHAFDHLHDDREFIREQRKLDYERMIAAKSAWGKLLGFVPLYSLIVIYLLLPMLFVSAEQMQMYYRQMQSL